MLQSQPCTLGSEPGLEALTAELLGWVLGPPHSLFPSAPGYAGGFQRLNWSQVNENQWGCSQRAGAMRGREWKEQLSLLGHMSIINGLI